MWEIQYKEWDAIKYARVDDKVVFDNIGVNIEIGLSLQDTAEGIVEKIVPMVV